MTEHELKRDYFEWIYELVSLKRSRRSYRKLFALLHSIDFTYHIAMDGNRAEDGIDLRYRFGYEEGLDGAVIASYLDNVPCSVLEMMTALAIRCEEHIMGDPVVGDQTAQWFWNMIESLGLYEMYDSKFNEQNVRSIISNFLNRNYDKNGKGGLFTVPNGHYDMCNAEIWYQMMWWLDEIVTE